MKVVKEKVMSYWEMGSVSGLVKQVPDSLKLEQATFGWYERRFTL